MATTSFSSAMKSRIADGMPLPAWSALGGLLRALGTAPRSAANPAPLSPASFAPAGSSARARAAVIRAARYRSAGWQAALKRALDDLGTPGPIVKRGDRVVIKVSLVGGCRFAQKAVKDCGRLPTELYWTHPDVARVVAEWARDSGAAKITFVEALSDWTSWRQFGYQAMAARLGADFVDLNRPTPYPDFVTQSVGPEALVYDEFRLNRCLVEADAFISVAKLKRHSTVGFTAALKNLVGILPVELYREEPRDVHRSALHRRPGGHVDMARTIVDLAQARPIHLAVDDGILSTLGSEGPWNNDLQPLALGTLVVSTNAVAADAVALHALGLDPTAEDFQAPFDNSLNYLRLADRLGLGPHRPADIALTLTSG